MFISAGKWDVLKNGVCGDELTFGSNLNWTLEELQL